MDKIYVTKPSLPDYEAYAEEIKRIWKSNHITNFGPQYQRFLEQLRRRFGYRYIDVQCNGHLTLQNILSCIPRGEIITTPFTFVSTALAITNAGHTPVFCDINEDDYNIDVSKIEALITDKTVAIVPVHVFGSPCDVNAIADIARKHSVRVIYDAAHAFGVSVDGESIGNFGDASMFSFHATKVFNSIEGGMGVFREEHMLKECVARSNFGMSNGEILYKGINSKMNEFSATMGLLNLDNLSTVIKARKNVTEYYDEAFGEISALKILSRKQGIDYNYAYYPIVLKEDDGSQTQALMDYLAARDIFARRYFFPAINDLELFEGGSTPVAKKIADSIICLPLYASMTEVERCRVKDAVRGFFGSNK